MNEDAMLKREESQVNSDENVIGLSRRRLIAGTAVAGMATAFGATLTFAQSDESTPEAEDPTSSAEGTPAVGGLVETSEDDEGTDILTRVDEVIAEVQADRDAVSGTADLTLVDQVLAQATGLRDAAQAATDEDEQRRLGRGAIGTARAAHELIGAQLSPYGLPSQEAPSSRVLENASERISAVTDEITAGEDADVDAALSSAVQVYSAAYDLYNAGTYAQAAKTGRAAAQLAQVAALLSGEGGQGGVGGLGGGPRSNDRQRGDNGPGGRPGDGDGPDREDGPSTEGSNTDGGDSETDRDEPVEVPAPSV